MIRTEMRGFDALQECQLFRIFIKVESSRRRKSLSIDVEHPFCKIGYKFWMNFPTQASSLPLAQSVQNGARSLSLAP